MTEETAKIKISYRIKQVRKHLKIKQKDFAQRLKISAPTLSELEAGKYYPSCEFLINLHREFNVNVDFILFGKGKMFADTGWEKPLSGLEELSWGNDDIRKFLHYFEHSAIMRYYLMSQFKMKLMENSDFIEKEVKGVNESDDS